MPINNPQPAGRIATELIGDNDYHRVIHSTQLHEPGNGWRRSGVVLAVAPPSEHHRYVVWTWFCTDEARGLIGVEQGDYILGLEPAIRRYEERGGEL